MIKKLVKSMYSNLKRLRFVRRFRYSEVGWFLYFSVFKKVSKRVQKEKDFYNRILRDGRGLLAFDIGANVGINTSHLLKLGYRVVAVEPEKQNFEALEMRYKRNPNVSLVQTAISDIIGQATLEIEEGDSLHTLSQKWKSKAPDHFAFDVNFSSRQGVNTTTLDQLMKIYGKPDLIKVDVEGYEYKVFCGLSTSVPVLIFEANLPDFYQETVNIVDKLKRTDKRYRFSYYFKGKVIPFSRASIAELPNQTSIEIICVIDIDD